VLQRANNPFDHTVDILNHVRIPEAQCPIAMRFEDTVAEFVAGAVFILAMLGAVEFDHKPRAVLDKIQRIAPERCLAPEVITGLVQFAKLPPQAFFEFGGTLSQQTCFGDLLWSCALEHRWPPTRSAARFDLPTKGR